MTVVFISTDRSAFAKGSDTRSRFETYAKVFGKAHFVVVGKDQHESITMEHGSILSAHGKWRIAALFQAYRISTTMKGVSVVSAQDPFEQGVVAWLIAKRLKAKFHVQIHTDIGSPYFKTGWKNKMRLPIAKFILPRADAVRVVSERVKDAAVRQYKAPLHRVSVLPIHTKVDPSHTSVHLKETYPEFDKIVLLVARLEREKNISLALHAFAIVAKSHPKVGFLIVGGGSEKEALSQLAVSLGIDHQARFVGFQSGAIHYFKEAAACLLTSDYEGYGRTLIEAAAADCPIVTTDVGLVGSILTKESALICPPRNAKCLAGHLSLLLENPKMARHLTAAAKKAAMPIISETQEEYLERYRDDIARALQ